MAKFTLESRKPPTLSKTQRSRLLKMTDSQITRAARSDEDNPPLETDELGKLETAKTVKRVRAATRLSQPMFAKFYFIKLSRLRDWEQGRVTLDSVSQAYLRVIEHDPNEVLKVLRVKKSKARVDV